MSDDPGKTMRMWRERFRLQQVDIANYLDISPSVISDYESGRRKSPGSATIRRFVMALITLDEQSGGQVVSAFLRLMDVDLVDLNIVLAMSDLHSPLSVEQLCKKLKCDLLTGEQGLHREIYGYSVVDAERAVKELNSEAFLKIFGAATDRCLVFTKVNTGRAPMVAIKSQEFKPTFVILHGTPEVDRLTIDLAEGMNIPLATSGIGSIEDLIKEFRDLQSD
ncbi:MAG: helix-turn-helix domain-containing protein [Candidatus Thorarchaeota archaeon]|nr:helix-turn-helix domain-containing protein [Candidatus Thorarchaeota archaeon]